MVVHRSRRPLHRQCLQASTFTITTIIIPVFPYPCIYAGDFNCQHTNWGYNQSSNNGNCLVDWAANNALTLLYDPKEPASFLSGRWNTGTNPDLAFATTLPRFQPPDRRVLGKFPRSQHRPSLITAAKLVTPTASKPVKRWNFRKANWNRYCLLTNPSTKDLPSPQTAQRTWHTKFSAIHS